MGIGEPLLSQFFLWLQTELVMWGTEIKPDWYRWTAQSDRVLFTKCDEMEIQLNTYLVYLH